MNFNIAPYYDDFDPDNKFYRVLYRPSFAVQGRELNQVQSIVQEQIRKFGNHVFEHGAMVLPGQITLDKEISYQKMLETYANVNVNLLDFVGYKVIGDESGVIGTIMTGAPADSTDPLTFYMKYENSGDNNESIGFWDGETIYREDDPTIRAIVQGVLDTANPTYESTGKASITSIDKGVYYINGIFVDNDAQTIIVSKYDQRPTCRVGLRIYESVITPEDDSSLTDNAQGTENYSAPGAHRYKIDLKLEYVEDENSISDDFVVLQYLRAGEVVKEIRTSNYSELEKTFARRTFDESGSYTVNPFKIAMREHLRDGNVESFKEGIFFESEGGDESKIVAEMGKGKAYVQGYEILKISSSNVELDKARDVGIANNSVTNFSLGNYIKVQQVHNIPHIDEFGEIELYSEISTPGNYDGFNVGTAKVRAIKRFGDEAYLYLFDISMIGSYSFEDDVKWIYDDSFGAGSKNFTCRPIIEDTKLVLQKPSNNILLFDMPNDNVKTLSVGGVGTDTNYSSTRAYYNAGIVGNISTLVAKDNEVFQQNTADYYIADASSGDILDNATFNFVGTPTGKVLEIGNLSGPVNVIAPVTKTIIAEKTKELQTEGSISISVPNKKPNDRDYLGKADVVNIKAVYMSQSLTEPATTSSLDITDRYQMDTGQRDNYYDVGSIILNSGQIAPTGQLLVEFEYFTHSDGDYFSVDSYSDLDFAKIPVYDSSESGGAFALADSLDFRPRMADDRSGFVGVGATIGELPQVFSDVRSDYEYYLNRIDYLYLDYRGDFRIARGVSAVYPKPPEKPETGMILYEIYVNAYTFKPTDAEASFKDNKRYTMKDIGDLDRRIGSLEYYTALSLLERETASMEILDQTGLNRFKNGFIVDPFNGHNVGDATHSDYNCAIDPHEKIMRPKFNDENISLTYDEAQSSHVQRTGGIISLPYVHAGFTKQIRSSKYENINPFAFRNIFGKLVFNPNSDVWHDKEKLPTLVVNHSPNYEALKHIADNVGDLNGVEWGRWNDVGGRKAVSSSSSSSSSTGIVSRRDTGISHDAGWLEKRTTTTVQSNTSWKQNQTQFGIKNTSKDSNVVSESLGDRVTEVNYVPYMRSIPVLIKTDQMKKNTKLYPFFDNIALSAHCDPPSVHEYCTPASILYFSASSGDLIVDDHSEETIVGEISGATAKVLFQTEEYLQITNMKGIFQIGETISGKKSGSTVVYKDIEIKILGDPIISGDQGEVALVWNIPNDEELKFMTGERDFVLTDQITNADPVHTYAKGPFKAHGMSSKSENTVLSTKTIEFTKETVKQNRTVARSSSSTSSSTSGSGWYDPLAQSFLNTESGGCFLTKVRVWFQSKDLKEGVVCEIRNMVNGYPAEITMIQTTLQPAKVQISEREPGEPTDFIFPEPIYLTENEDYCFVLKPAVGSASFNVWVAENGKIDIGTGEVITGKESLGSLFKSQNASTWTPNQNEDIMFELFKADFDISSSGQCMLVNDEIDKNVLVQNAIETYQNTNRVRIHHKNHGLNKISKYVIGGLDSGTDYNGFLGTDLLGEHDVFDVEIDSIVIVIDGKIATDSGSTGGTEITGIKNFQLDTARPVVNEMLVDETSIDWEISTCSGQSVDGDQTPYVQDPFVPCLNNEDIDMTKPMLIASKPNETEHLGGEKSLKMMGYLHSDNTNVSPIIDASEYDADSDKGEDVYFQQSTSTMICIANRIDNPKTELLMAISSTFLVGAGEDELVINHPDHQLGNGAMVTINEFTDFIPGIISFDPNGTHEVRIIDMDNYLIDMKEASIGYAGDGGGTTTIEHSQTHYQFVPETKSFDCSTASRYMIKQVTLENPAENFKLFFGAVREQEADIDVYYKIRTPYEVTEWNEIDWIRLDRPDEDVAFSQNNKDVKDFTFTQEDLTPFNAISIKLVMKSTNSTQVPIHKDFRLICTT